MSTATKRHKKCRAAIKWYRNIDNLALSMIFPKWIEVNFYINVRFIIIKPKNV
jgi:hypothetical protein